jgi:3-oxoacyl-[acyl-carrier-protein] synthase II
MTRIVVTGMGVVSPLGCGAETVWTRLLAGQSGLRRLPEDTVSDVPCKIGGLVPSIDEDPEAGFDVDAVLSPKDQKKADRFIHFALAAAAEALSQARWSPKSAHDRERTATIIASGIGGFPVIAVAVRTVDQRGVRRLSPFTAPAFLPNLAAGWVTIVNGFKGPLGSPTTACAASVQAIGDAARLIRSGEADVAVCGGGRGVHRPREPSLVCSGQALSTNFNDDPSAARERSTALMTALSWGRRWGLVIEALEHALARGARPIVEVAGYGTSADAYHITEHPTTARERQRAMRIALTQAGLQPATSST